MSKTTSGIINVEAGTLTVSGQATFLDGVRSIINHNFYTAATSTWPRDVYTRILNWTNIQTSGQILTYSNGFFTNNIGYGVYVAIDFSGHRGTGSGDSNYRIVANSTVYNQGTVPGQLFVSISASVYLPIGTSFFIEGLHTTGTTQTFDDCRVTYIIQH
jgi:hypothetical protein